MNQKIIIYINYGPEKIIKRKFTYTNSIMEKEFNKIEYAEFIYKVTFL